MTSSTPLASVGRYARAVTFRRRLRIALGAVAPTPLRATKTEAFLEGKSLSAEVIDEAAQIASKEVAPIDDVRASEWYRRHLAGVFVRRFLENAARG